MFVQSYSNLSKFEFILFANLTLILQSLTSHLFASIILTMEVAINITSQSSIIISRCAQTFFWKKVKGVSAV